MADTTTPTNTTPQTQLDVLKNSLRVPSDLKDDDTLLQSYIDGATEYLASTLNEETTGTRLDSKRAKVVINALAELMYQNRVLQANPRADCRRRQIQFRPHARSGQSLAQSCPKRLPSRAIDAATGAHQEDRRAGSADCALHT